MKQKAMSMMVIISLIVFSTSLCNAGFFSKKSKKYIETARNKCTDTFISDCEKCRQDGLDEKITAFEMEKCLQKAWVKDDECSEPDNLEISAKELKEADKMLKKAEKIEDKCKNSSIKALKKCTKKKGKKIVQCNNDTVKEYLKCLKKADKIREEL